MKTPKDRGRPMFTTFNHGVRGSNPRGLANKNKMLAEILKSASPGPRYEIGTALGPLPVRDLRRPHVKSVPAHSAKPSKDVVALCHEWAREALLALQRWCRTCDDGHSALLGLV